MLDCTTFSISCNTQSITNVKYEWPEDFGDVTHVQIEGDVEVEQFHWKVFGDPCTDKPNIGKHEDEE
uniref:Phenolic acid decarboxylase n=1 Tax=Ditylenchus dipsaci TaxID=166011 RepID=A0A915D617_9BILA